MFVGGQGSAQSESSSLDYVMRASHSPPWASRGPFPLLSVHLSLALAPLFMPSLSPDLMWVLIVRFLCLLQDW